MTSSSRAPKYTTCAALALALVGVVPFGAAQAQDPPEPQADTVTVEVSGVVVASNWDDFDNPAASRTEYSILTDQGDIVKLDDGVAAEGDLAPGAEIEATLLVPEEYGDDIGSLPSEDAYAVIGYNTAVPSYTSPTPADYTRYFDVAVVTPDGTWEASDSDIAGYIEAVEQTYVTQTGLPFNFVVNDIRRGSTTAYSPNDLNTLINSALTLYGHSAYSGYYLGRTDGSQLLIFAPSNKFLVGVSWDGWSATCGHGVNSGGEIVMPTPASIVTQVGTGSSGSTLAIWMKAPTHEIGHVMGLGHTSWYDCANAPTAQTWNEAALGACTWPSEEYRDGFSFMGGGFLIGGGSLYQLGLLAPEDQVVIDTAVTNQSVTLRAMNGTTGVAALVISDVDAGIDYFVEYRNRFYTNWSMAADFQAGVYITTLLPNRDTATYVPGARIDAN
ncbi:MAG: M57 family metalloprotease, partial [Bifidobacteriaceae bacterium]|nr:M57 family metalloprotease [Bifidobacteriaceae bacterium]